MNWNHSSDKYCLINSQEMEEKFKDTVKMDMSKKAFCIRLLSFILCMLFAGVCMFLTGCTREIHRSIEAESIQETVRTDETEALTTEMDSLKLSEKYRDHRRTKEPIRIGVTLQGLDKPYIDRLKDGLWRMQYKYNGQVAFIIRDGQEEADRQNAQIEEFIVRGVDAIIYNPISYKEGSLGLELAHQSGIPVVLMTTTTKNAELASGLAISNHVQSAHFQMDMAAEYSGGIGNIAILKGPPEIDSSFLRTKGYEEKLKEYPGFHVIASQSANWSSEEAYAITENWIRIGKKIDIIIAQNDNMAIGAYHAIRDAGLEGTVAIFGIDGDMEALELIKEGKMQGTVYHDAVGQTELAVSYAVALARGKKVESHYVPYQRVDISNVDNYIAIMNALNGNYENRF